MSIELDRHRRGVAAFALNVSTLLALKKNGTLADYELAAGLGARTAVTLRSYITRHNWGVDRIIIELQHEKIAAADRSARVDKFRRFVHLKGSEGQR
jgi:hypothetical protein